MKEKTGCMYTDNFGAIRMICQKVWNPQYGVDFDDLLQQAYLEVKLSFEPTYNPSLCTPAHYLFTYLPHKLRRYQYKYKFCDSLNEPLAEDMSLELIDVIEDDSPGIEEMSLEKERINEIQQAVRQEIEKLPEAQRKVINLRYIKGLSISQTSKITGYDKSKINYLQEVGKRNLRGPRSGYKLKKYIEEARAYRHVTLTEFKYTFTSAVEKALRL